MKHAPLAALDQRLIALSDHWPDSGADYAELQAVTDAYTHSERYLQSIEQLIASVEMRGARD